MDIGALPTRISITKRNKKTKSQIKIICKKRRDSELLKFIRDQQPYFWVLCF
jgi:hypothetical protein